MAIDRRSFLKATAAQTALIGGAGACARLPGHPGVAAVARGESPFQHGVASGDPLADRVIVWTRVSPVVDRLGEPIEVEWWIAPVEDPGDLRASGRTVAWPDRDYTVKVDATGLEEDSSYVYGFRVAATDSPLGRTRTLPGPDARPEQLRMAVTSCSNLPEGFFNAYASIAEREDLDLVLHLGDYIYEYANGRYGDGTAAGRLPDPVDRETVTLAEYRQRHGSYKRDPDLQAAHARHPWITIWDDHESANNAYKSGAQNHSPDTEGEWSLRKLAAIRAYYEWMPIRELPTGLFRRFQVGDLLDLVMLDTRLQGRDAQGGWLDSATAYAPERTILGEEQARWLLDALSDSVRRGARWRVLGQQVVFTPQAGEGGRFNPDSWSGYQASRRRLLDHMRRDAIDNVVFLTGDVHSAWAFEIPEEQMMERLGPEDAVASSRLEAVQTPDTSQAVEFVTPAVSSPPLGRRQKNRERLEGLLPTWPHARFMNLVENGYLVLEATQERVRAEFVFTDSTQSRSSRTRIGGRFEVQSGTDRVRPVNSRFDLQ